MKRNKLKLILATIIAGSLLASCKKDTTTKDIFVPSILLDSLAVKTAPLKTQYLEGDVLDLTGLVISLIMENGNVENVAFTDFTEKNLECDPANGTPLTFSTTKVTITHAISSKSVNQDIKIGSVADIDGNVYKSVTIGSQEWMAENLKVTRYSDGTMIQKITDDTNWSDLADGNTFASVAYCVYDENNHYGYYYTWAAAMGSTTKNEAVSSSLNPSSVQGVCPVGWHLPSDAEWKTFETYLADNGFNYDGSFGGAGDKIAKALATDYGWYQGNTIGSIGNSDFPTYQNKSGFSALPEGYRYDGVNGTGFSMQGLVSEWWSSTESDNGRAYQRSLAWDYSTGLNHSSDGNPKSFGFSVRCIKD